MTVPKEVPDSAAEAVAIYLTDRIGLSVAGPRRATLLGQIAEAMVRAGTARSDEYCAQLDNDEVSFDELVAAVTVGESYFFREPRQLDLLRSTIVPERRRARGPGVALHLWSAGCAIGQEAYTLAIVLEEEGLTASGRIVATDISRAALGMAAAGVYGSWSLRAATDAQKQSYFRPVATGYRVDERFARSISFQQRNLLDPNDGAARDIDVILCRNVLIYLAPQAIARVARNLADSLAPGGWLVTGSSDPPLDGLAELEPTVTAAGLVYRRSSAAVRDGVAPRAAVVETAATRPRPRRPSPLGPAPAPSPAEVRPESASAPSPAKPDPSGDEAARVVRALGGAGDLAGALDTVVAAIGRFPLHTELRYLEAIVLLETGRPADAASSARAALYLEPGLVVAHLALARAEAALGHAHAARRSLRNAAALLAELADDAPVPMSDGEVAGRLAAMAAAHDRALVGTTPSREKGNP